MAKRVRNTNEANVITKLEEWINSQENCSTLEMWGANEGQKFVRECVERNRRRVDFKSIYTYNDQKYLILIEAKKDEKIHQEGEEQVRERMFELENYPFPIIGIAASFNLNWDLVFTAFYKETEERIVDLKCKKKDFTIEYLVSQTRKDEEGISKKRKKVLGWKEKLVDELKQLHENVRNYCKAPANEKVNLLNGIFIALRNEHFRNNINNHQDYQYSKNIYGAIVSVMTTVSHDQIQIQNIKDSFAFLDIDTHPTNDKTIDSSILGNPNITGKISFNKFVCNYINDYILTPLEKEIGSDLSAADISSIIYNEFIRYAKGDGSDLGIVLTPDHISDLMVELLELKPEDVLLDICTGSGAFLVSGMKSEIAHSANAEEEKKSCSGLIGVELQPHMYALSVANMIFNGGDISNLYLGSCYEQKIIDKVKELKPTKAVLNPPYAMYKGKVNGDIKLHEWSFINHAMSFLPVGGKCIAIIPTSCGIHNEEVNNQFKAELMSNHTLDLIIQCPDQLFYPTGVVTNIYMFTANVPHNRAHSTFTYNLKDDSFKINRKLGRIDSGSWNNKKGEFLKAYNSLEVTSLSNKLNLKPIDEWDYKSANVCPEFRDEDFIQALKNYHNATN